MKLIYSNAKFNYSNGYLLWDDYIYLYDIQTLKPSVKITANKIKIYETKSYFLNEKNGTINILDWKVAESLPDHMIFFTKHGNNLIFFNGENLILGDNKKIFPKVSSGGGGVSDHQELDNLQGGGETERYHLTETQYNDLTDGGNASGQHLHDDRYSQTTHTHTHNSTTSIQGGSATERYHLTETEHDTLTNGSDASLLHIHNAEAITFTPLSGNEAPGIVTALNAEDAILQVENYLYNVFGVSSLNIGISYTGLEYESLGIYEPT